MNGEHPPRRLRIAIVAEHVNLRAGQERVVAELSRRLAEHHHVELFCFSAEDVPRDQITVRRLPSLLRSNTFQALWIVLSSWLLIRPRRYDVVMSQGGNCLVQNFVLAHTCHARRGKELNQEKYPGEKRPNWWLRLFLHWRNRWATAMERRAIRRCAGRIIAVSPPLARMLREEYGLSEHDILTARNAVDHETFNPALRQRLRPQVRAELGLGEDEFIMLFAGGLWYEKGLPQTLAALSLMRQPARLLVLGRGDQEAFGRLAEDLGVRERVVFLGHRSPIERYYAAADCFAFPSPIEGLALVTMEAAASGLPPVIARLEGTEEFFTDGQSAFLVGPEPAEMADRLDRLAADRELRERMGEAAHWAVGPLNWDDQAQIVERFLLERCAQLDRAAGRSRPLPDTDRQRIAVVSHSCVLGVNQKLYATLAARYPDLQVLLVIPSSWRTPLSGQLRYSILPEAEALVWPLPVRARGQINLHWYPGGRLAALLADFSPHLVLADEEPYSLAGYQSARLADRLGARLAVYTKQNILRSYPPPFHHMQDWVLRHARHVLVVSEACASVVRRRRYAGPITVVPHGVDSEVFRPRPQARPVSGVGKLGPLIGYVGRLDRQKGVMDLLQAASVLSRHRGRTFELLLIGDGPLRGRAQAFAARHLPADQVHFLGYVSHASVPEYISMLDVLVLPSRTTSHWREQFGRVLLEALAAGVPVVGSDSGHIPRLIEETRGGLVFREGHSADLAAKLEWMLTHPAERAEIGTRGREVVLARYTVDATADMLNTAVREVLAQDIPNTRPAVSCPALPPD